MLLVYTNTFVNQQIQYIHFVKVDKFLSANGWDPQFMCSIESLAWCNGLPEPSQMYNDKAIERYNKYYLNIRIIHQSEDLK